MENNSSGVFLRPCGKVLVFVKDGEQIGELDWSMGKFHFFGDAGESADVFFKILMMWSNQLPRETLQSSVESFFTGLEDGDDNG